MKHTSRNISILDRMMVTDSLLPEHNGKFGVSVISDYINYEQSDKIIDRANNLYDQMELLKDKIYELYGEDATDKLMSNFYEIIIYSAKVSQNTLGEMFDEFFQKLEGFCGQIENILKMIRYYYNIFSK